MSGAYLIDSSICPIPVVSEDLIITDRAKAHLAEAGWKHMPDFNALWCEDCQRLDPHCPVCKGSGYHPNSNENWWAPCEECGGDAKQHKPEFYGEPQTTESETTT